MISANVLAFTNPKGLSGAQRNGSSDLALQDCHVNQLLCQKHHQWPRSECDVALMRC